MGQILSHISFYVGGLPAHDCRWGANIKSFRGWVAQRCDPTTATDFTPKVRSNKPVWWEPRWADPQESIVAAKNLKIKNFLNVSAGLGLTPSPNEHLRRVRNFLAHRNQHTASELIKVYNAHGLPDKSRIDGLTQHVIAPGVTVFEQWIAQLRIMASSAIQ